MTPEEITAIFATAAAAFQPIVGQPSDDDLTALRDILYPLLLDIPYTEYAVNDPTLNTTHTNTAHAPSRYANTITNDERVRRTRGM